MAKLLAAVFLVVLAVTWPGISAQTHHVVGDDRGWSPDLDVGSWLSGRVFTVGDKIWFKQSGIKDSIVEVSGLDELISCNLTNPIRMYTDPVTHVALEKEGARYFTSGNLDNCKKGLKLPVTVKASPDGPFTSNETDPFPDPEPKPKPNPSPFEPQPTPPFWPFILPPPPPPPHPSAATHMNGYGYGYGLSVVSSVVVLILAT